MLEQSLVGGNTLFVVAQAIFHCYNTIGHFASRSKLTPGRCHQAVGSVVANPYSAGFQLTTIIDVVILSIILNEAQVLRHSTLEVVQTILKFGNAILQLTIGSKHKGAGRKRIHALLRQIGTNPMLTNQSLTTVGKYIVVIVYLEPASILQLTHLIEEHSIGLFYNAVEHLAIRTKLIITCRKQTMRRIRTNPDAAGCHGTIAQCIVVIFADLDQTAVYKHAILAVIVDAIYLYNTIGQSAHLIKEEVARLVGIQTMLGQIGTNPILANQCLTAIGKYITFTVMLYPAGIIRLTLLIVVGTIFLLDNAFQHLSVCTKLIVAGGQRILTMGDHIAADPLSAGQDGTIFIVDSIVVFSDLDQTSVGCYTFFHVEQAVAGIKNASQLHALDQLAVLGEVIPAQCSIGIVTVVGNGLVAGICIAGILCEVVFLSIDGRPCARIILRAIAVTSAQEVLVPCAAQHQAFFIRGIGQTINLKFTTSVDLVGLRICVAITLCTEGLPAGHQLTSEQIILILANGHNAGFIQDFSAVGICTSQVFAVDDIVVAQGFNRYAPLNHRVAALAIGTTNITSFGTGSSLVFQRDDGVLVQGVNLVIDHSLDRHIEVEGTHIAVSIFAIAEQYVHIDGDDGPIAGRILSFRSNRLTSNVVHAVPGPDAHRQGQQGLLAGQSAILGLGQHDADHVFHGVDVAVDGQGGTTAVALQHNGLDLEARRDGHALEFPLVCGVQLDIRFDVLNLVHVAGLDVQIVDGIVLGGSAGIVAALDVNKGLVLAGCDGEDRGLLGDIALIVGDFKGNSMHAVVQHDRVLGTHALGRGFGLDDVAVHVDHRSGEIQTSGVRLVKVGDRRSKGNTVGSDGRAVGGRGFVRSSVHDIADFGLFTIVDCRTVVQRDVVDIEGQLGRSHGLDIGTHEGGRTGVALIIRIRHHNEIICGKIDGGIYPAVGRNVCCSATVQVLDRSAHGSKRIVSLLTAETGMPDLPHPRGCTTTFPAW